MPNITYWEARQRAYLKCSRELRAIACSYLNDTVGHVELCGDTAEWALVNAVSSAKKAREIEMLGFNEGILSPQSIGATTRSQDGYHKALDAFHSRLARARGIDTIEANGLSRRWLKAVENAA